MHPVITANLDQRRHVISEHLSSKSLWSSILGEIATLTPISSSAKLTPKKAHTELGIKMFAQARTSDPEARWERHRNTWDLQVNMQTGGCWEEIRIIPNRNYLPHLHKPYDQNKDVETFERSPSDPKEMVSSILGYRDFIIIPSNVLHMPRQGHGPGTTMVIVKIPDEALKVDFS